MNVAIASVGFITAQGSVSDMMSGRPLRLPCALPWPAERWTTCRHAYRAVDAEPLLTGKKRWRALAEQALRDCFNGELPSSETPLLIASCNGAAAGFEADSWRCAFDSKALLEGTPWAKAGLPVFSGSCNSGMHALYLARQLLLAGYSNEIVVLAVDILSPASHDNFESLRVLTEKPAPWQSNSSGFITGEAAVALRLVRTERETGAPCLDGPVMGSDLAGYDALSAVLSDLQPLRPGLILGQGTGPFQSDELELCALRANINEDVPLATPLMCFGHTLGASSLLSVALGKLLLGSPVPIPALLRQSPSALDGRPLYHGSAAVVGESVLVTCRALNGACAAASLGAAREPRAHPVRSWHRAGEHGPLMHSALRQIAVEAPRYRPPSPPDILMVRMDEPLTPHPQASIGGRLLPSAVLEMTPGFVPQLIARCWGFTGASLCLVGGVDTDRAVHEMIEACKANALCVSRVNLLGGADNSGIEWDT